TKLPQRCPRCRPRCTKNGKACVPLTASRSHPSRLFNPNNILPILIPYYIRPIYQLPILFTENPLSQKVQEPVRIRDGALRVSVRVTTPDAVMYVLFDVWSPQTYICRWLVSGSHFHQPEPGPRERKHPPHSLAYKVRFRLPS
ncbi:hypothetical protein M404DRAFT_992929, partial [Pisolithus tinctorius Marx 270]